MRKLKVQRVRRYGRPRYRAVCPPMGRRGRGNDLGHRVARGAVAALVVGALGEGCHYEGWDSGYGGGSDGGYGWGSDGGVPLKPPMVTEVEARAIFQEAIRPALIESGHGRCFLADVPLDGEGYSFEADLFCEPLDVGFEYLSDTDWWGDDLTSSEIEALRSDGERHLLVENGYDYEWGSYTGTTEEEARAQLRTQVDAFIEELRSQGIL